MTVVVYVIVFLALWVVLGGLIEADRSKQSGHYDGALSESKMVAWACAVLLAIVLAVGIWKRSSPIAWIPACIAGAVVLGFIVRCLFIIWQCRRKPSTTEAST